MSSIPLRPIHKLAARRVNGYAPLDDPDTEQNQHLNNDMSATGSLSSKAKGKKRVRYNDEPAADDSENVGLLEGEGDLEEELDDRWKEVKLHVI